MKIIAIGRNYADHAKEMNSKLPEEPMFFLKPDSAILRNNAPFFYPDFSNEIHYEVEVVLKISRLGKNIETRFAHRYYEEIGMGIDFTARDLQREAKNNGLPWAKAKAFDGSAPISPFIKKSEVGSMSNIDFRLELNGDTVQKANTKDMIFSFDEIISHVSKFFTLKIGDLIFTGTPSGVGPVKIGDHLNVFLQNRKMMDFYIK